MVQRLIPGHGYVDDEGGGQRLIPGVGFIDATEGVASIYPDLLANTQVFYSPDVYVANATQTILPALLTNTQTFYGPTVTAQTITISDSYERSSVNVSLSSAVGLGDSAVITIQPRYQESEIVSSGNRWWEFSAKIDGVNGSRPTFVVKDYRSGYLFGHPWDSGHRCHFSYDRITWYPFDTIALDNVAYTATVRHNTAFTADTVYFSNSPQFSVHQIGDWIAELDAAYASINPTTSANSYTPTSAVSDYAAQAFICDEFSTQTDELGRTIQKTPLYGFEINDTWLMPTDGLGKRVAVVTAGVHAAEDIANHCLKYFVEAFLGSSAEAQAMRRQYRLLVYPMINAPGRAGGGWRGSFTQGTAGADDANRHFTETTSALEIVDKPKAAITADRGGAVPDFALDFHGQAEYGWSIYTPSTVEDTFRTRQAANASVYITDMSGSWGDAKYVHQYFHEIGSKLSTAVEIGDANVISMASIASYHTAMVTTLKSMLDDGYLYNSVQPSLVTNAQTFFAPSITVGNATIAPPLLTNGNVIYPPIVVIAGGTQYIQPPLLTNPQTFYVATVGVGAVVISPPYFENPTTVFPATITGGTQPQTTLTQADIAAIVAAIFAQAQVTPIHSNVQAGQSGIADAVWAKTLP